MEEKSLKQKVDELSPLVELMNGMNDKQRKRFEKDLKIPRKAKVSKSRMKKGWIGVLFANPNKVVKGEKVKLEGGTFQTKDKIYHVTDGHEIAWWEGKHPFIWQRYDKLNPTNLFPKEGDKDEMYGQDMIMLRMKRDLIKDKPKGGMSIVMIIAIIVGGYLLVNTFFPGLLGG